MIWSYRVPGLCYIMSCHAEAHVLCVSACLHIYMTLIGWPNNDFNNIHVITLFETNETTTCAADTSLRCVFWLKHMLLTC